MLNIAPRSSRTCEGVSRRHLLQVGTLGGLGLSLPTLLRARKSAAADPAAKGANCILIWTQGGTSHRSEEHTSELQSRQSRMPSSA